MTWLQPIDPPHTVDYRGCPKLKTEEGCYWCCDACNYDRHICPGCGTPLSHLGHEITVEHEWEESQVVATTYTYTKHEGCTD